MECIFDFVPSTAHSVVIDKQEHADGEGGHFQVSFTQDNNKRAFIQPYQGKDDAEFLRKKAVSMMLYLSKNKQPTETLFSGDTQLYHGVVPETLSALYYDVYVKSFDSLDPTQLRSMFTPSFEVLVCELEENSVFGIATLYLRFTPPKSTQCIGITRVIEDDNPSLMNYARSCVQELKKINLGSERVLCESKL